ncbi:MAG: site-2 protease family protein, partial [Chlorobiales bacterium]|nr:site-2 protease family protein [Chlorobiales bacterium]
MQDKINNVNTFPANEVETQNDQDDPAVSEQKEEPKRKLLRMPLRLRKSLHFSLFLLTIITTYLVGFDSVVSNYVFENNISYRSLGDLSGLLFDQRFFGPTLVYVLALLGFLTAHEMGHYLMCRKYGIKCTLPIYLPNPFIFGTFGAVIRIKSPIRDKKALFDIGIAGPLAGFIVALPILIVGMSQSIVLPASSLSSSSSD